MTRAEGPEARRSLLAVIEEQRRDGRADFLVFPLVPAGDPLWPLLAERRYLAVAQEAEHRAAGDRWVSTIDRHAGRSSPRSAPPRSPRHLTNSFPTPPEGSGMPRDEPVLTEGFARQRRRRTRLQRVPHAERRRRAARATVALARRLSRTNNGYRELYGEVPGWGLDAIPPLSKDRLRAGIDLFTVDTGIDTATADRFLAAPFRLGSRFDDEYVLFATSGSGGKRIHIPYHLRDFACTLEAFHWRTVPRPRPAARRLLYIGLLDRHNGGNAWMYYLGQVMHVELDDVFADPRALLTKILKLRPDVVVTRPHIFVQVGHIATSRGVALPPARLISVGEPLLAGQREDVDRYWERRPHNSYSTVETGPVAFESEPASDHLDVYDDLHLVEILDKENRPVTEPGVTGQVTITTLYRERFPLVRYQPGDLAQWRDQRLSVMSQPLGRIGVTLAMSWPGRTAQVAETSLSSIDLPQVRQYQVRQVASDALEIVYELAEQCMDSWAARDALHRALRDRLIAAGCPPEVRLSCSEVDVIVPDHHTGKIRRVVPLDPGT